MLVQYVSGCTTESKFSYDRGCRIKKDDGHKYQTSQLKKKISEAKNFLKNSDMNE